MFELSPRTWLPGHREDSDVSANGWIGLYLLSLAVLIPTFIIVIFTVFLLVLLITLIQSGHGDVAAANLLPWVTVGAFIAWASSGLLAPTGAGSYMAYDLGAREPTTTERLLYEDAISALELPPNVRLPRHLFVLDQNDLNACVIADTLIINRELLDSGYSEAVIAHELGHLNSMDGRVSVAVNRLGAPARGTRGLRDTHTQMLAEGRHPGFIASLVVLIVRGCSGGLATNMLAPAWAGWWRLREYAADDYAARLGQAEHLANLLETHGLLYDTPIRRIWSSTHTHPPVALRMDRLRQHQPQ